MNETETWSKMILLEKLGREEKVKKSRVLKVVRVRKWHLSVVSLVTPQGFLSHSYTSRLPSFFFLTFSLPLFFHSLSQSLTCILVLVSDDERKFPLASPRS